MAVKSNSLNFILSKGQSLFEVVVAIGISAVVIVALVSLAANSIRNATFSKNKTIAARYAEETTEWLRGQRDSDIGIFFTQTEAPGVRCFPTLNSWPQTISNCDSNDFIPGTVFFRTIEFIRSSIGSGQSLITASVVIYWDDAQGTHEVRSTTNFTDWRER